ncbi:type II toxin-antitoxin system RelE/ParE family toxin [Sediminispirochaeta smaragdinae]|uniref:Plasmid stabilization system n=1 Tax=Sediminispirochaeta smaragdinae (strain DSM 11293 / JCM 15392 / SEBR 4228) TaxID=573413 RepID=E1R2J4_SEDSS|nr:type II toxin-antitoxin system RelE/ParE family toxin [Sediminispirochaeta smaragdinae]ADK82554.1 plasmid stabilization system [Sediminispirochaeta smaragdinae DSM 11293]
MNKQEVIWTEPVLKDLNEIIEYISFDSVPTAIKQYERIKETAGKLELCSEQGRIIPELQNENIVKYREMIIRPWRLMYRMEGKKVLILALIDGRRNIEDILIKRNLR